MLEIAAAWRCVIGKWNAGMSQPMLLEILRITKLAVIDRQYRAKTRLTQSLELPWFHVWTTASGEQVWNEPEYVVHGESLAVRPQHKPEAGTDDPTEEAACQDLEDSVTSE